MDYDYETAKAETEVYAAQPREGTETLSHTLLLLKGTQATVYAAQPREGTETCGRAGRTPTRPSHPGLCSSTPRGDGN